MLDKNNNLENAFGPGVAKQWFGYLTFGMVNLDYGLFNKSSKNYYHINPQSTSINVRDWQYLEFIGKIFAKAAIEKEYFINP